MSVLQTKPKLLEPNSRQFPFDEVVSQIVDALKKRDWNVPEISLAFDVYGSGEAKYELVRVIASRKRGFKLRFGRVQGSLEDSIWNDTAAVRTICIPKQIIEVYDDESGPTYYLYVGDNWDAEKDWFMDSIKVHSRLNEEPRRYLRYKGNTYKTRATYLVADNDLGREYSPEGDEPRQFNLEEKFAEFTDWLRENVLNYILTFPEKALTEKPEVELIPYKGPWETVYSFCSGSEAERIIKGKKNPKLLPKSERHAYFGSGRRLVPLSTRSDTKVPRIANEGFIWCDVNPELRLDSKPKDFSRAVSDEMRSLFSRNNHVIAVSLKYANDVYVVDNAAYEETREKLFEAIAPRERLTDKEYGEVLAARGATIVPITEYKGDYKEPIVLIRRELDFDEISAICYVE